MESLLVLVIVAVVVITVDVLTVVAVTVNYLETLGYVDNIIEGFVRSFTVVLLINNNSLKV